MAPDRPYQVELRTSGVRLEVGAGQTIYEAALAAGVQLPVACRYGGCITCAARLVSGKVRQPGATALNRRQARAGYVLLCVARPVADCVIDEGVDAQDALYQNPFATGRLSR